MTERPKLLLHICCAPDEAIVVHELRDKYELRCFFCNPNIQPESEYHKRRLEAEKTAKIYDVPFDYAQYVPDEWENAIADVADTPERGERCKRCFLLRLKHTAAFCSSIGWPDFTTVMSVSPHKAVKMIDEAGIKAAYDHNVNFIQFNFKKNDGFLKSIRLSRELGLYRQNYCGCRLSKAEHDEREKRKQNVFLSV
jgi:predicted adenine nucleotide alpha hydrolase (AANH) superfamily ATPase